MTRPLDWAEPSQLGVLPNGTVIGRYVLLSAIGKGGMGVVYRAYDPDLDRRIALKILRGSTTSLEQRERQLAEAKALAKLSPPNVVSAYDAGSWQDAIYIAMELVEGQTLAEWLKSAPRSRREVVDVMIAAGRGLEAAHRVGIVHRDFKPQNVIVATDGRARVIDFGIAWQAPTHEDAKAETAIAGSPGYMAPEQSRGEIVDGAADQFAFCATLYLGLYGVTAFTIDSWSALQEQIASRTYNPPLPGVRVPAWLARIVERGLQPDKRGRFASMTELLAALTADPMRRWRRAAIGISLVGAVAAGAGLMLAWKSNEATACHGAESRLVGVWDAPLREKIAAQFAATGRPHAKATFERVARLLTDSTNAWTAMRTDACEATRRRHEQSEEMLELRLHCLDQVLDETRSTVTVLATMADPEMVDDAVQIVGRLPSLKHCADPTALRATYPPPSDPSQLLRVRALNQRLTEIRVLERAGKYLLAMPRMTETLALIEKEKYPPLEAQALATLSMLQGSSGEWKPVETTLARAMAKAAEAHDDALLADGAVYLLYVVGQAQEHGNEAFAMAPLVDAIVARSNSDRALEARRRTVLGMIKQRQGQYAEAQRDFEAATAIARESSGEGRSELAEALNNLASVIDDQARSSEALPVYREALAIQEKLLGAEHPRVASVLNNLGLTQLALNQPEQAEQSIRRALAIWIATFGPDHPEVARTYNNLGLVLAESGKRDEARAAYATSLAVKEKLLGPDHPSVAAVLEGIGVLANLEGRFRDGLAACTRAEAIVEKAYGGAHPNLAYYLTCKGIAASGLGRRADAVAWLERALSLRDKTPASAVDRAATQFALARALRGNGHPAARDRQLATEALAALRTAGARPDKVGEIETFLAAR